MRLHMSLDDDLVKELDRRAGSRRRSAFIEAIIRRALDDAKRWDALEDAVGSIPDSGHDWDGDAAAWVRQSRRSDDRRVG